MKIKLLLQNLHSALWKKSNMEIHQYFKINHIFKHIIITDTPSTYIWSCKRYTLKKIVLNYIKKHYVYYNHCNHTISPILLLLRCNYILLQLLLISAYILYYNCYLFILLLLLDFYYCYYYSTAIVIVHGATSAILRLLLFYDYCYFTNIAYLL